ncbi:hypothetical protein ACLKA7_009359 [Drosophila subpalustris]
MMMLRMMMLVKSKPESEVWSLEFSLAKRRMWQIGDLQRTPNTEQGVYDICCWLLYEPGSNFNLELEMLMVS